jgi:predicted RNA-binding Zn-ribbon protein involved in translation (DUF1610 family)
MWNQEGNIGLGYACTGQCTWNRAGSMCVGAHCPPGKSPFDFPQPDPSGLFKVYAFPTRIDIKLLILCCGALKHTCVILMKLIRKCRQSIFSFTDDSSEGWGAGASGRIQGFRFLKSSEQWSSVLDQVGYGGMRVVSTSGEEANVGEGFAATSSASLVALAAASRQFVCPTCRTVQVPQGQRCRLFIAEFHILMV